MLLLENVRNILRIDDGEALQTIYKELEKIGYKVSHALLNTANYGLPTVRWARVFCSDTERCRFNLYPPAAIDKPCYLKEILLPDSETAHLIVKTKDINIVKPEPQPETQKTNLIGYVNGGLFGERIYSPNGQAITLTANSGGCRA